MIFKIKEYLDLMAFPLYRLSGSRPWSPGYFTSKKKTICKGIDESVVGKGKEIPARYGYRIDERVVEYPWVFSQLPSRSGNVLDAGSALNFRYLLEREPLNRARLTIMTLAPEKRCFWERSISYVFGDLRQTEFADDVFDVVVSVSTIEHIGLDNTQLYTADSSKKESDAMGFVPAVREFKRLLKPGGLCLVTVPFGRPGVHGWYQVFDQALVMKVIESFEAREYTVEYFGYDVQGWQRVDAETIKDVEFFDIHEGKDFDDDFAAGARGVACIRMVA